MKKILCVLLVLFFLVSNRVFAFEETLSKEAVLVDWTFAPELETNAGYNIDAQTYGLLGKTKLDLTSQIYTKSDKEFKGKGDFYGLIVLDDFEVKVYVEDGGDSYNSTTESSSPFVVSWGKVRATLYAGPVYFILKNVDQENPDYIETLDDEDLDFSSISYSIIPAAYTGSYSGVTDGTNLRTSSADSITGDVIGDTFSLNTDNQGGFSVGLDFPEVIKVELGLSTEYTFRQRIPVNYNPFAISLESDIAVLGKLLENYFLKVKASYLSGVNGNDLLQKDNPTSVGLITGYGIKLASFTLTPKLAGEMQIYKIDENYQGSSTFNVTEGNYFPFETAVGVSFDWKEKGYSYKDDEDDHLDFSNRDVKVQDGASIAFVYGHAPYVNIGDKVVPTLPYIGMKLSAWESEDSNNNRLGILPGLQAGLIFNLNYAFGGTVAYSDLFSSVETARDISYDPRLDIGVGSEMSYKVLFLKPYAGVIYKIFNILEGSISTKATAGGTTTSVSTKAYENRADLRSKVGLDVEDIVKNVIFNVEWQSGDMINDQEATRSATLDGYNFFENNVSASNNDVSNTNTLSRWGYISAGVKIIY